jgi:Protein of unknown function (DUF3108)
VPVRAQTQPFVPPTPGTTVFFSTGGYFEADSVDGTILRVVNSALQQRDMLAACYTPSRNTKYDRRGTDSLWPLAPGKTVTLEEAVDDRRWSVTFRVVRQEQVKTRAGTFEAWLITADETALTHTFKGAYQCWYVPEIGLPVKRSMDVKAGKGSGFDEEAMRVEKHDRSKVAEFRAPAPGTTFNTTAGSVRIDSIDGPNLLQAYTNPDQKVWWLAGFGALVMPDRYAKSMGPQMAKIWPLEVGKSTSFQRDLPTYRGTANSTFQNELTVEKAETVTVPAGTFSTFVIKWRSRGLGFNTSDVVQTIWWSPALGFPVKREARIVTGYGIYTNYELRSVQRPPR